MDQEPLAELRQSDIAVLKTWFSFIDTDKDGRITAREAAAFFLRSDLSPDLLKGVWAAADSGRQGFLELGDFAIAMKLIGQLQKGEASGLTSRESSFSSTGPSIGVDDSILPQMRGLQAQLEGRDPRVAEVVGQAQGAQASATSWGFFKPRSQKMPEKAVTSIIDGLKELYKTKLKPLEVAHKFHDFVSPELKDSDFDAKPMILLLGQYSTGKTTFIKSILGKSYPGSHIGPEPTTDRFTVVMDGVDERTVPGHTAAVQSDLPFYGLNKFGSAFLEKFEVSQMPHQLLRHFSFVDSPGVLSGEKQRTMRSYDFTGITEWFATKSDLILLLFDPHKLDISDEFKRVIGSLKGNYDKIRVVLNKADQMESQQLMRVYGALMWSLGKVLNTPEVTRVYIGSFSDKELPSLPDAADVDVSSVTIDEDEVYESVDGTDDAPHPKSKMVIKKALSTNNALAPSAIAPSVSHSYALSIELCRKEQEDLLNDLCDLPQKSADRKINEFVKRARSARVNALVTAHLRMQMPMFGRPAAQANMLKNMEAELAKVQREFHLPPGDMPDPNHLRDVLVGYSFDTFEKVKPKLLEDVSQLLSKDVPDLLQKFRNPYG